MKRIKKNVKTSGKKEEKVVTDKPKKEFKIEIVKVGKLEENTAQLYECQPPM